MTQVWPGFGEAPVPTVVSMICRPEAVVMVFPAVWAAAVEGTKAAATNIAATIEIITRWMCRILRHLPFRIGRVSSARRAARPDRQNAPSFRDGPKDQTRNLEIPGSMLRIAPE